MHVEMSSDLVWSREPFVAIRMRAFEWAIASMRSKVFLEIRALRESSIAVSALERTFVGMSTFMDGECARYSKRLTTALVIAYVRFLSCVLAHMLL